MATPPITIGIPVIPAYVPYGAANTVSIYVRDTTLGEKDFTDYLASYDFTLVQNRIAIGVCQLWGVSTSDQNYLTRNNRVKIFVGNTLFYVYRIKKMSFNSTQGATLTLEGIECTAKDSLTDRSTFTYEDTASNTITNDLISGIFSQGTITDFGKVFFRAEYNQKLKALMNQAVYHQADWWLSWKESESYNTDYWNITASKGSGTSKYIFNNSGDNQNVFLTFNAEDNVNLANHIICLGSGEGTTQLVSKNFHATDNRTALNGGDTWLNGEHATGSTTITVDSTTGFPSSGTIKIGKEEITYTGTTTTTFTGCSPTTVIHQDDSEVINLTELIVDDNSDFDSSGIVWVGTERIKYKAKNGSTGLTLDDGETNNGRGNSSTSIYAHADNIEVYDQQYTTVSPETGSSIQVNGLLEQKFEFLDIINQNMLDLVTQKLLAEKRTIKKNIMILPFDFYDLIESGVVVGDTVTVKDTDANLDSTYIVRSYHLFRPLGRSETIEIECAKEREDFVTQVANKHATVGNVASYTQGTVIPIKADLAMNCDTNYNANLRVFLPKDTVAIKYIKLAYNVDKYRYFQKTSSSDASHAADYTNFTCTTSFDDGDALTQAISNATEFVYITVEVDNVDGDDTQWYARVYDGTNYYPSSAGIKIGKVKDLQTTGHRHKPGVGTGYSFLWFDEAEACGSCQYTGTTDAHKHTTCNVDYHFWVETPGAIGSTSTTTENTDTVPDPVYYVSFLIPGDMNGKTLALQIKKYSGSNTSCDVGWDLHIIGTTYGITEANSTCSDIAVYIDDANKTSTLETQYGELSTSQEQELDLKAYTNADWRAGEWHTISVRPTGKCWIDAQLFGLIFLKDT